MKGFSVREAVLAGPRLMRERPGILMPWALFMIAFELFQEASQFLMAGRSQVRFNAFEHWNPWFDITGATLSGSPRYLLPLLMCVFIAFTLSATNRAALRPTDRGVGYFQVGVDELRQMGLVTFLYVSVVAINLTVTSGLAVIWGTLKQTEMAGVDSIAAFVITLFVLVRMSLASAATFETGRISLRDSWKLTSGQFWPIVLTCGVAWLGAMAISLLWTAGCYQVLGLLNGGNQHASAVDDMRSLATYLKPARLEWIALREPSDAFFWLIVIVPLASIYQQISRRSGEASEVIDRPPLLQRLTGVAAVRAPEQDLTGSSFRAVIESDYVDQALGAGASGYRKRWLRLAEKAGVLDTDIHDPAARRRACWTPSWNPMTPLSLIGWLVYRKVKYGWAITILFFVMLELLKFGSGDLESTFMGSLICILLYLFITFSDGWLLSTVVSEKSRGRIPAISHYPKNRINFSILFLVGMTIVTEIAGEIIKTSTITFSPQGELYFALCNLAVMLLFGAGLVHQAMKYTESRQLVTILRKIFIYIGIFIVLGILLQISLVAYFSNHPEVAAAARSHLHHDKDGANSSK